MKQKLTGFLLALSLATGIAFISGCGGTGEFSATGVTLNESSASIQANGTEQLSAVVTPSNTINQSVTWSSDNTLVATVNSDGLVSAVSAGTANIKVTTVDGGFTASCVITVSPVSGPYTEISGDLTTQTLTKAKSPYHVVGDIRIPRGHTLTIEPGTFIDFKGHYKLDVEGHLKAIGTATERIVFTATDHASWAISETAENRGWNGIRFIPYPDISYIGEEDWLEYCEISYASKAGNTDINDLPGGVASYINSTGGAVYLSGRPSAKQLGASGSIESIPITFHFNNNFIHHNLARRAGGGFFTINTSNVITYNPATNQYVNSESWYRGDYTGNVFENNKCDSLLQGYSGGGFGEYHSYYHGVARFFGGAFRNNTAPVATTGQQLGGWESGLTVEMTDVIVEPAENWLAADMTWSELENTPAK